VNRRNAPARVSFNNRKAIAFLLCALAYLCGAVFGRFAASWVSDNSMSLLSAQLIEIKDLFDSGFFVFPSVFKTLIYALFFPIICFLCGFSALGFFFVLTSAAARAFVLGFSSCVVMRTIGKSAWSFVFCVYGIPEIIRLPCFLYICVWAHASSFRFYESIGGGRARVLRGAKGYYIRPIICLAAIAFSSLLECFLAPFILSRIL